ncbi:MAG: sigma 54-interacting transcriptional regulator [Desulfatitalea sp.]|nr:sigma 54-interacting transcriptional regulator [Desulfatitalea sp.]
MATDKEKFFIKAINLVCSSLDITVSVQRLRNFLVTTMPVDHINLSIYEPELKCARTIVSSNDQGGVEWVDVLIPMDEKIVDFIENKVTNEPVLIHDLETDERVGPATEFLPPYLNPFKGQKMSIIALGLIIDGKWIGTCAFVSLGEKKYQQHHVDLLAPLQEPFALMLSNCLQYRKILRLQEMLAEENQFLQKELRNVSSDIIGQDYGLKYVMEMVNQIAPKESHVLLLGETGTGKEVIANAIHRLSPRKEGPFVKVNCGAIPENLMDSELFGHEKGAFTGAFGQKKGRFERAKNGTIFLDEIGELPLAAQVRLLRVIQHQEIERVGGTETIQLSIRIIAATHRDLTQMALKNEFREDLLYRINVFPISIPPLRQRKIDIPALVDYFVDRKSKELKLNEVPKISKGSLKRLIDYHWPGNVRELENVVERALIRFDGGLLTLDDILIQNAQTKYHAHSEDSSGILAFDEMARRHIVKAIKHTNGRISGPKGAAALLQMHRNTLRSKMKKLGL